MAAATDTKDTIKYQMKKPCDHFLLKTMLQLNLNVTDDCKLSKVRFLRDFYTIVYQNMRIRLF